MPLNAEQSAAVDAVRKGRNIFLTGAGGTGKSHTIRAIVAAAADAGLRYAVTATTGCAALLLNQGLEGLRGPKARTIHSWTGIGLGRGTAQELTATVKRNRRAAKRWRDAQLLVIDEISMMTPELLEKLDHIGRELRKAPELPFGGLRLVFVGDFCQLPPVQKGPAASVSGGGPLFAFESPVWSQAVHETHLLTQIVRQSDPVFQRLLNEARLGALSAESIKVLEDRMGLPWHENEIRPTLLFTRNAEVDRINRKNLDILEEPAHIYDVQTVVEAPASDVGGGPDAPEVAMALERLDSDAPYEIHLELRKGAQVMLLTNKDQERGLVNGSRGIVTGYTLGDLPIVKFQGLTDPVIVDRELWRLADHPEIGRSQIPLRVAYACTIHKSQGASLDSALIDVGSSTFEYGQAYVALSRVRSLFGLYIWKLDPRRIRCHPRVLAFYEGLATASASSSASASTSVSIAVASEDPADPTETTRVDMATEEPWTLDGLSGHWSDLLTTYFATPAGGALRAAVAARRNSAPRPQHVFEALRLCPDPAAVRVIILGQDPYHTLSEAGPIAHGLAFSTTAKKLPPSLTNIYKELVSDVGPGSPGQGNLTAWAKQGVLLLNDILTVSIGAPLSHQGIGWEQLTQEILLTVLRSAPHVVILAWGRNAQKKLEATAVAAAITSGGHTVLKAPHPSPLSAHTGFFGSKPFSQTNSALVAHSQEPIRWLPV